jgi:hypothetical protein
MKQHILFSAFIISVLLYSCSDDSNINYELVTHEFMDTTQIPMPLDTMVLVIYPKEYHAQVSVEVDDNIDDSLIIISKIKGTELGSKDVVSYKSFSITNDTISAMIDYRTFRTKRYTTPTPQTPPANTQYRVESAIVRAPKEKVLFTQ